MNPSIQARIGQLEVQDTARGADAMSADAAQALTRSILTLRTVLGAPPVNGASVIQQIAGNYPDNLFSLDKRLSANQATPEDRLALAELSADDLRTAKQTAVTLVGLMAQIHRDF